MLKRLKEFFFGRYVSEEEKREDREFRKRAKMHMLGAAGCAVKPDEDGIIRVVEIHVDDVKVSNDHDVLDKGEES